jgi:hypothetical protein
MGDASFMVKGLNVKFDYFRRGLAVSPRRACAFDFGKILAAAVLAAMSASACAQYVGTVKKPSSNAPQLRAIAVLEWTGDEGKPKFSRLVPVSIFDGEKLNDASIYMARPQPIALAGEVEYQLKKNGKTVGIFDIKNAGQEQGSWVGYGEWKPPEKAKPGQPALVIDEGSDADDKPVLHRKKHTEEAGGTSGDADAKKAPANEDPDRPKLHKKDDPDASGGSGTANSQGGKTTPTEAPDDDQPTLHKHTDTAQSASGDSGKKHKKQEDEGHVENMSNVGDPDRPHLQRGKSSAENLKVVPSLMGLPPDMQQAVAVSDVQTQPDHPWSFSWASPDEAEKMKAQLEAATRTALALNHPAPAPAPESRPGLRRGAKTHMVTPKPAAPASTEVDLHDVQFRVFELAYGAGATMVYTANTGGPLAQERFVTFIAQPDLYGNMTVLLKYLTDGAHLDDNPQMRLIDAVDAEADNRGELLFELRGSTQRSFALYRVARSHAEKLFAGAGGEYGSLTE